MGVARCHTSSLISPETRTAVGIVSIDTASTRLVPAGGADVASANARATNMERWLDGDCEALVGGGTAMVSFGHGLQDADLDRRVNQPFIRPRLRHRGLPLQARRRDVGSAGVCRP